MLLLSLIAIANLAMALPEKAQETRHYPGQGGVFPGQGGGFPGQGGGFPGQGGGFPGQGGGFPGQGGGFPGQGGGFPGQGGGFPGQGGGFPGQGGGFPGGSSSCKYWCRTPENQAYCCENGNQAQRPTPRPTIRPGICPPVRPQCPPTRFGGPPQTCSSDSSCTNNYTDKCCFDRCLEEHVCKPPQQNFGR
uniref:Re-crustin n=2 Tax=Rimicaris exoculata TaxID=71621 RepID=A0A7G3QL94_RIMEX|nr:re-crustin [Rimicaris exoculata]